MTLLPIPANVILSDICCIKAPAESRDDEELSVQGPHDPGALLGDDLGALYDGLGAVSGVEDPDAAVLADSREEPAALAELGAVQLERETDGCRGCNLQS